MKLSDFAQEGDTVLDRIDYPLFRASAAKLTELDVTAEQFVPLMRFATQSDLYWQSGTGEHIILGMKINIL